MEIQLTIVDFGVLGILLVSGLIAAYRGFLKETLTVSAWLLAALAAVFFWPVVKPFARTLIEPKIVADILALVGVFFLMLLIPVSFVSFRLSELVRESQRRSARPFDGLRVRPRPRTAGRGSGLCRLRLARPVQDASRLGARGAIVADRQRHRRCHPLDQRRQGKKAGSTTAIKKNRRRAGTTKIAKKSEAKPAEKPKPAPEADTATRKAVGKRASPMTPANAGRWINSCAPHRNRNGPRHLDQPLRGRQAPRGVRNLRHLGQARSLGLRCPGPARAPASRPRGGRHRQL